MRSLWFDGAADRPRRTSPHGGGPKGEGAARVIPPSPPYISHNPFRDKGLWYPVQILTYNSTHKMPDRMLKIAQVMELTGLSRSTIYAMIKRGDFPDNHPIGSRAVAWREADVLQWLRDRGVPVGHDSQDQQMPDLDEQAASLVRRAFANRNRRIDLVREKLSIAPPSGKKRRR